MNNNITGEHVLLYQPCRIWPLEYLVSLCGWQTHSHHHPTSRANIEWFGTAHHNVKMARLVDKIMVVFENHSGNVSGFPSWTRKGFNEEDGLDFKGWIITESFLWMDIRMYAKRILWGSRLRLQRMDIDRKLPKHPLNRNKNVRGQDLMGKSSRTSKDG